MNQRQQQQSGSRRRRGSFLPSPVPWRISSCSRVKDEDEDNEVSRGAPEGEANDLKSYARALSLSLSLSLSPEIRSVVVAENEKVDDIQRRRCRNFYYLMSLSSPNKLQALVASAVRKDKEKQPQVQTGSCCALYERVVLVIVVVKARFSVDLNPTIFALQISYVTSPLSTTFTPLVPR